MNIYKTKKEKNSASGVGENHYFWFVTSVLLKSMYFSLFFTKYFLQSAKIINEIIKEPQTLKEIQNN